MAGAATGETKEMRTVSVKGSLQAIRSWESRFGSSQLNRRERLEVMSDLYLVIAHCQIPHRPGRSEPRCMKRRPKPFQLLTKPRHEMREIQHRNRYRAETA